ncbi:hypothetical protein NQZ68_014531 [Dissostichus eleginoides]|nr:hypothetical protein NQZ68_014531 [Dissostichus eleginoides]
MFIIDTQALRRLGCVTDAQFEDVFNKAETLDVILEGMQVGLLIGHEGPLLDSFPLEVFNVAVVVEEKIIL